MRKAKRQARGPIITLHNTSVPSFSRNLVKGALYNVPLRAQQLDRRLPTEQMAALRDKLRVVDMRLAKAHRAGDNSKIVQLTALQSRLRSSIQRVADEIVNKQWPKDDRWLAKLREE